MSDNTVTVIGWLVVPVITAVIAYYQHKNNQKLLDERANVKNIEKLLENLLNDSTDFWMNDGGSDVAAQKSVRIKRALTRLEQKMAKNDSTSLMYLRMEISEGEFDSPERKGLPPTHEKFHHMDRRIKQIRNDLVS